MDCSWKKPKGTKLKYINGTVSNRPNDEIHNYVKQNILDFTNSKNKCTIGLLLTNLFMYFNFVPFGFFQIQSIDYLWIDRKTLVNRSLYKEFIKGTTRVENITL